ncbi:MAG: hypothetical protein PVF43_07930, partial [Candidatus Eiseniibacteriota bacterium]
RLERDRLNAIDPPLLGELRDAVEGVRASRACRAMLLESASQEGFIECWFEPATHERLREVARTFRR